MRKYQILTKFTKEEHTRIIEKAQELGLPKSTYIRYEILKVVK